MEEKRCSSSSVCSKVDPAMPHPEESASGSDVGKAVVGVDGPAPHVVEASAAQGSSDEDDFCRVGERRG